MAYNGPLPQVVKAGGSGAATLTGVLTGNGTSPFTASSVTQFDVLVGGAANAISSVGPGSAGQVLQSAGNASNPAYSTATYPAIATGTGTLLRADGTNWVATTSTYPNTNAINTLLYASASNVMSALATANNGVLITSAGGVPSWLAAGTTGQVLTATTGSPASWVSPASGGTVTSVSVVSANGFAGTVATATTTPAITISTTITGVLSGNGTAISGSAITQHDVLVGGASNAITSVAPSATSGVPLISQGASSDPAFGTAVVAGGGTGVATTTAYGVICGGTTSTGALQNAGAGTSGQLLVSGGASALPAWTGAGASGASLVFIQSQATTAVASVTFNLSNSYDNYVIILNGVRPVTGGDNVLMQVSTGSFITTGYSSGFNSNAYNSATTTNTNLTTSVILGANVNSGGTPVGVNGQYVLCNATAGTNYTTLTGQCVLNNNSSAVTHGVSFSTTGTFAAVTQIKFFCTSSNLQTGTIILYGIRGS